jgi:maltose O-acetyltransferase
VRRLGTVLVLRLVQAFDRLRLALRAAREPGLEIDPSASSNLACARFRLGPGARLRIGPGVVTERHAGLHFLLEPGAQVEVGEGTWLRTEISPVYLVAFAGARIEIGPEGLLNGCHLSAKRELRLGRRVWIGPGTRVFDADQHDRDAERPERVAPVEIGDFAWIASDATVLRGVRIGEHSIVGTRSLVTRDVPPHTLAFGQPAVARGPVGDRSKAR